MPAVDDEPLTTTTLASLDPVSVPFADVRTRYRTENDGAKDDWTLGNLVLADQMFGSWVRVLLPVTLIGGIALPHHVGACDRHSGLPQSIHLVPPSGLTVSETHARLRSIEPRYRELAPHCFGRIERAARDAPSGLGTFFLSRGPILKGTSYGGLSRFHNRLTHLDGLHRLLGLTFAPEPPTSIECFVATGDPAAKSGESS